MRILIDLQACQTASRHRGIGRYALAFTAALTRIATTHEVSLLLNAAFPDSVERLRDRFAANVPIERIHVFAAPAPVAELVADNQWRTRAAEAIREALVATLRPDVVLLSSLFEGFVDDATTSISSSTNVVSAAILYDLIPLVRPETLATDEAKHWYARKLESLRRADLLLAISEHSRAEAVANAGLASQSIAVISTAADSCFKPVSSADEVARAIPATHGIARPYVLYAGGFDARKNVAHLIAAFAALEPSLRRSHELVLAGSIDEHERRQLQRTAARVGIDDEALRFTGYVDDDELAALYGLCAVFAFPSLHEGFGLPVLEAMACGAAVIGASTTSIPEVIGRGDALFDPTDVESTAALLTSVLTDDSFRAELGRHGLERSRQFAWETTAQRALDAMIECHTREATAKSTHRANELLTESRFHAVTANDGLPSLAFISPLPPERTGIAYYSVELLASLRKHYRIELIADQRSVELPATIADLPVRSLEWFDAHGVDYDRVLYQIGNSPFHHRMFDALERHPGTIVLHDLHLGGVLNWMDQYGVSPGIFSSWLFDSHGYPALLADRALGRDATIDTYPCSWPVVDNASGIVVHSRHALRLAEASFRISHSDWQRIPQVRRLPDPADRAKARRSLGLAAEDILFCSFGFVDATKLNDRVIDAWLASPLATDTRCTLVFVGEMAGNAYGRDLSARIAAANRIYVTGYVDGAEFDKYLCAADIAIQLRGVSRGETSRTALDCLAQGLPLIVNASGSLAELPETAVVRLPEEFSDDALSQALTRLARDETERGTLGRRARAHVATVHDPDRIAVAFHDAIEHFARSSRQAHYRAAVSRISAIDVEPSPNAADWRAAAQSIAVDLRRPATRQILVDISVLTRQDLRTGIERVVRAVLRELLHRTVPGWRVEPVKAAHGCYVYARSFTTAWLELGVPIGPDTPIEVSAGDVFIGLDWAANIVPEQEPVLERYRTLGVNVAFVVYDLLPVMRPDFYPRGIDAMHAAWLATLARVADGALCISNAVADDLTRWLDANGPSRGSGLKIDVLPLGADVDESVPTCGLPENADALLKVIRATTSVLMVGTVEPRKGHAQALGAFETLWARGVAVNLVIVGKQGWMVDELAQRLRAHPQRDKRLFWFENATDEWLEMLYANVDVLLAPSFGEGYGLPLIEAARHRVALLVRDLPVFREVAGDHATYFSGTDPASLSRAVVDWMKSADADTAAQSGGIRWSTWRTCVDAMLALACNGRQWQRTWRPDEQRGDAIATFTRNIDFSDARLPAAIRAIDGLSVHEPWGRWSDANAHPQVDIRFREPLPARGTLTLTARAFGPNVGQPVRVRIGSHEVDVRFDAHDTSVVVTYEVLHPPQSLQIVPPYPARPSEWEPSADRRRLGIGLVRLTIDALPAAADVESTTFDAQTHVA